jgi:hypothetical protein
VRDQIVFIGVAQEKAKAFSGTKVNGQFQFNRDKTVYVNHYYFYIDDEDFGPLFLKVCSYAPWGIKLCLNGHEWAKRQLEKRGIEYEALDNGFLSCAEPEKLQQICDSLGPASALPRSDPPLLSRNDPSGRYGLFASGPYPGLDPYEEARGEKAGGVQLLLVSSFPLLLGRPLSNCKHYEAPAG